jgi:hypothetical protein
VNSLYYNPYVDPGTGAQIYRYCGDNANPGNFNNRLTDGNRSVLAQACDTQLSYEIDLSGAGAAKLVTVINIFLSPPAATDFACNPGGGPVYYKYGFPEPCPPYIGPYIENLQIHGDSGSGYTLIKQYTQSPNSHTLSINAGGNYYKKIKITASGSYNWIGVYEVEVY